MDGLLEGVEERASQLKHLLLHIEGQDTPHISSSISTT